MDPHSLRSSHRCILHRTRASMTKHVANELSPCFALQIYRVTLKLALIIFIINLKSNHNLKSSTNLQILQHWLGSSSNESVSSNEPSMMASLLLPMPLLPDESKSNDSNILISLMVNGSTVVSVSAVSVASVVAIATGGVAVGATLPNISADAIVQSQCFRQTKSRSNGNKKSMVLFQLTRLTQIKTILYHSRANQATFFYFFYLNRNLSRVSVFLSQKSI